MSIGKQYMWIVLIYILAGCSDNSLSGPKGESFRYSDKNKQDQIISELTERDVDFIIDSNGYINYSLEHMAIVLGIQRSVESEGLFNPNSLEEMLIVDDKQLLLYEAELSRENIPYRLISDYGDRRILWTQNYGPQVDVVRQRVELQRRKKK
jgi:hypothetical protein